MMLPGHQEMTPSTPYHKLPKPSASPGKMERQETVVLTSCKELKIGSTIKVHTLSEVMSTQKDSSPGQCHW